MASLPIPHESSTDPSTEPRRALSPSPRPRLWSVDFVLIVLVQFCYGTAFSSFFILPKYLIEALEADAALVGNAHGAFALVGVVLVPLIGSLLDDVGRRPMLLLGLSIGVLSFAPFGWVTAPWALLGFRVLHGVSFALVFNAGAALVVDLAPEARRAEAIGYFGTAMLCTNAFGPLVAELLAEHRGWSTAFIACSMYSAVALLLASKLSANVRTSPSSETTSHRVASLGLLGVYLGSVALGVGVGASKTFVPAALVEDGVVRVAPYFVAFTGGALFQRMLLGWLPDRIGHLRASVLSLSVYACAMFLVLPTPAEWIPFVAVGIGLAHGLGYPAIGALAMSLANPAVRGRVTAWLTGGFNLGFAISTAGLARLEPWLGYRGLVSVGGAMLLSCAVLVPWIVSVHRARAVALAR